MEREMKRIDDQAEKAAGTRMNVKTRPRHHLRAISIATAMLTGLSVATLTSSPALAGGAQASPATAPPKAVRDVAPPAAAGTDVGRSGYMTAAASIITCYPNVQNPHKSTHVPGTVNVVVTLTCTAPVPQINSRAALYRNGRLVKDSGQKSVYNTSFASHNAATACVSGWHQGWMSYGVLFPPGYSPPTGASSGFGNSVYITC